MGQIIVLCLLAAAVGALAGGLWFRRREKRTLETLDAMLEAAQRGDYVTGELDESLLSAVEHRMADYLDTSTVSARNLRQEKETIKTLIGDISHQTKTPIANLLLYAQLLTEQPLSPEGRACAQALETGVLALQPVQAPLAPMLAEAVAQLAPKAEEKGIARTLQPTQEEARFDPKWTAEAVCNLLDNGIKYTPAGGRVTVAVRAYELFCRVDVTDTGVGLSEEEQAKVFQRFYRGRDAREEEGVGIGLYLVRQIVTGQGGYVKVTSRPGEGSTFSLFLPKG